MVADVPADRVPGNGVRSRGSSTWRPIQRRGAIEGGETGLSAHPDRKLHRAPGRYRGFSQTRGYSPGFDVALLRDRRSGVARIPPAPSVQNANRRPIGTAVGQKSGPELKNGLIRGSSTARSNVWNQSFVCGIMVSLRSSSHARAARSERRRRPRRTVGRRLRAVAREHPLHRRVEAGVAQAVARQVHRGRLRVELQDDRQLAHVDGESHRGSHSGPLQADRAHAGAHLPLDLPARGPRGRI